MSKTHNNPPNDMNNPSEHFAEAMFGCNGVADVQDVKDEAGEVVWHFDGSYEAMSQGLLGSTTTDAQRDTAINTVIKAMREIGGLK